MNFLPKEIENIIIDYKVSIETEEQRILDLFNNMRTTSATYDTISAFFDTAFDDRFAANAALITAFNDRDDNAALFAAGDMIAVNDAVVTAETASATFNTAAIAVTAASAARLAAFQTYNIAYKTTDAYFLT